MCGHFIGFYTYSQLQHQPRALWRCSTCGRESRMPIDCCTRPLFDASPNAAMERSVVQWLQETGERVVTRLRAVFSRHCRSTVDVPVAVVCEADRGVYADDMPQLEEDPESVGVEERTHVSV
jgi:hypothetical protein